MDSPPQINSINIFVSDSDSKEYREFAKKFKEGNAQFAGLREFVERGEISAIKTTLSCVSETEFKLSLIKKMLEKHSQDSDALETAGTVYLNLNMLDEGFKYYDLAKKYGSLSFDGQFNYILQLLHSFPEDRRAVEKAWVLSQGFCGQFFQSNNVVICPKEVKNSDELQMIFWLLIKTLTEQRHIELLKEVSKYQTKESTPIIVKIAILQNFQMLNGTAFEGMVHRATGQVVAYPEEISQSLSVNKIMLEKQKRFELEKIELKKIIKSLDDVIWNNLTLILRDKKDMRDLPQKEFKDLVNPTDREYTNWTRDIINYHRELVIAYSGNNLSICEVLSEIDNTTLEKYVFRALKQMIEG